jgi:hypothetical protein
VVREVERHKDAVVKTLQESPGLVHLVFDGWTSRLMMAKARHGKGFVRGGRFLSVAGAASGAED